MPVADNIRSLRDRTSRDLDAVHDYFEHSLFVWQSFRDLVRLGHKTTTQNRATGTTIDQDGLVGLASHYTREYLATFTFRQFVSTFEGFLFEILYLMLRHNPRQLARKQLVFEAVLDAADREEIIAAVILKHLNELKYENLRAWFDALDRAVHLDCPSEDEIELLAEVKAARAILEDNAGIVNETYLRKAGNKARYAVGKRLEIDDAYHLASWSLIKKVVGNVSTAAVARLGSS